MFGRTGRVLFLILLPVFLFLPIILQWSLLTLGDHELVSKLGLLRQLRLGDPPWWTEAFNGGTLSLGSTSLPITVGDAFYAFFSHATAHNLSQILDFILAATGFYFWRRGSARNAPVAAMAGAVVYALSLQPISRMAIGHQVISSQFAWFPWMLLSLDQLLAGKRLRFWLTYPPMVCLLALATYPSATLVFGCIQIAYFIFQSIRQSHDSMGVTLRKSGFGWFVLGGIIGLAGASLLFIPSMAFARECVIPGTDDFTIRDYADHLNFPIPCLIHYILPYATGGSYMEDKFWANFLAYENTGAFQEFAVYSGLIPLVFCWIYRRNLWKKPEGRFWMITGLVIVIISLGKWGGVYTLLKHLPVIANLRGSSRFLVAQPMVFGVLTVLGMETWLNHSRKVTWKAFSPFMKFGMGVAGLALLLYGVTLAMWLNIPDHQGKLYHFVDRYMVLASASNLQIISILLLVWGLFLVFTLRNQWSASTILIGLLVIDLGVNAYPRLWKPSGNYAYYIQKQAITPHLQELTQHGRVAYGSINHCLPHNLSILDGTREAVGFKDFVPRTYMDLIGRANHERVPKYDLYGWGLIHGDSSLLRLLHVDVLVSRTSIEDQQWNWVRDVEGRHVYQRANPAPEAWLSGPVVIEPERIRRLDLLESEVARDPLSMTIVEASDPMLGDFLLKRGMPVTETREKHLGYTFSGDFPLHGLLCTTVPFYPEWEAWAGGVQLQTIRVNHAFIGVLLPQSVEKVTFRFNPRSHILGIRISLLSVGLWLMLVVVIWYRRGRGHSVPSKP